MALPFNVPTVVSTVDGRRLESTRKLPHIVISLLLVVLGCSGCTSRSTDSLGQLGSHFSAGWNLLTPDLVDRAASVGITVAFINGPAPQPTSLLGQALVRHHMRVVSGEPSRLAVAYECYRTFTVATPPPSTLQPYCSTGRPYTRDDLLRDTSALASRDESNPLVAGYWVLDDTPGWDPGSLRDLLAQMRTRLPSDRPSICGFGAGLLPRGGFSWNPATAQNYSPQACDVVAPYVYQVGHNAGTAPPPGVDWSMQRLLPRVESDLQTNGWKPNGANLLGIAQAYSGDKNDARFPSVTFGPTPEEMNIQAQAFCAQRAIGVAWYTWTLPTYSNVHTPANDDQLAQGVIRGSHAACA